MTTPQSINGETWNYYYPINSNIAEVDNVIVLRLPKSAFVQDLSRAFINLDYNIIFKFDPIQRIDIAHTGFTYLSNTLFDDEIIIDRTPIGDPRPYSRNPSVADTLRSSEFMIENAANIFDRVTMAFNGVEIYNNSNIQTNSKLFTLNKGQDWLNSYKQTFILATNENKSSSQLLLSPTLGTITFPASIGINDFYTYETTITKSLSIPLFLLFPLVEQLSEWPSFLLDDTLELRLSVSALNKYMVDVNWLVNQKYNMIRSCVENNTLFPHNYRINLVGVFELPRSIAGSFDQKTLKITNLSLHIPCRIPSSEERLQYSSIMDQLGGIKINFKDWEMVTNNTQYFNAIQQQQQSFNISSNNIYGIAAITLTNNNNIVFEKPLIQTIQMNLGPWQLASNGTHVNNNYEYGADLLQSILDNFSQSSLSYYNTINPGLMIDHSININSTQQIASFKPTGHYITYYDASPYDELGVSSNEFSNLIVYKYSVPNMNAGAGANGYSSNNYLSSARTILAVETFYSLSISREGVVLTNPNSSFLTKTNISNYYKDSIDKRVSPNHGFGALIGPGLGLVTKIGEGIAKLAERGRENRLKSHDFFFQDNLSPEEYDKYKDRLDYDAQFIIPARWRKTYRQIVKNRTQNIPSTPNNEHGFLVRHGRFGDLIKNTMNNRILPPIVPVLKRLNEKNITFPFIKPGTKENFIGKYRPRIIPGGRFDNVHENGVLRGVHGITSYYHGIFSRLINFVKEKVAPVVRRVKAKIAPLTKYIPQPLKNIVNPIIDPIKKQLKGTFYNAVDNIKNMDNEVVKKYQDGKITTREALELGKSILKNTGKDIISDIKSIKPFGEHGISTKRKYYSLVQPHLKIKKFIKNGKQIGGHGFFNQPGTWNSIYPRSGKPRWDKIPRIKFGPIPQITPELIQSVKEWNEKHPKLYPRQLPNIATKFQWVG